MIRGTGLGCGQCDPSGIKTTVLGLGEVKVFIDTSDHFTNWHTGTDFQENFTLRLCVSKRWRLKQGTVRHPSRGCTPHYYIPDIVESQVKVARLERPNFQFGWPDDENLNNSVGDIKEITMLPGDMVSRKTKISFILSLLKLC